MLQGLQLPCLLWFASPLQVHGQLWWRGLLHLRGTPGPVFHDGVHLLRGSLRGTGKHKGGARLRPSNMPD